VLGCQIFVDRLEHVLAIGQIRDLRRADQASQNRVALILRKLAACDGFVEEGGYLTVCPVESILVGIEHAYGKARARCHDGDTRAHCAATGYTDNSAHDKALIAS